jgi:Tfp pilus assembly protein PilE
MHRSRDDGDGFTLVALLIVIVFLGVLAGCA